MNDTKKELHLVEAICSKTAEGKLAWEPTASDDVFQTTVGGHVVRIKKELGSGVLMYLIELYSSDGEQIASYSDEDFESAELASEANSLYKRMKRTHEIARRKAMAVDDVLDALLSELEKDE